MSTEPSPNHTTFGESVLLDAMIGAAAGVILVVIEWIGGVGVSCSPGQSFDGSIGSETFCGAQTTAPVAGWTFLVTFTIVFVPTLVSDVRKAWRKHHRR